MLITTFKSHTDLYQRVKFSGNVSIWGGVTKMADFDACTLTVGHLVDKIIN